MTDVMDRLLAEFRATAEARGCPPGLTMEQMVLGGYATMAEAETLRGALEACTPRWTTTDCRANCHL